MDDPVPGCNGLPWQAEAKIWVITADDGEVTNWVEQGLVARSEHLGGHRREVLGRIDPLTNHHRGRENRTQNGAIQISSRIVGVQETPSTKVNRAG